MTSGALAVREASGGFDDVVHTEIPSWQVLGILLRQNFERPAVDEQLIFLCLDGEGQFAMDRVLLEEVRKRRGVGQVINRDEVPGRVLVVRPYALWVAHAYA